MADPVTLTAITIGATAAGAGVGALGKLGQGQSEAQMYNYQAGVARVNAQIAKQDANYTVAAGGVQQEQAGMRERANIGATRAGFGASNVAGGSKNAVVSSEIEVGQQNQGIVAANAAKRAYGFEVGAASDTATAGALDFSATNAKTAGDIGAVSSILGGVSSVSSKWLQMGPAFGKGVDPTQGGMGLYGDASTGSLY
jgi:hypothetical protein